MRRSPTAPDSATQRAVQQPERRAVAPAQEQPELVLLAVGHVRQVHDPRDDLAGHEPVVVVERGPPALAQPPLAVYASVIVAVPAVPASTLRAEEARAIGRIRAPEGSAPRSPRRGCAGRA